MAQSETKVGIDGQDWLINGVPTHKGREYRGWRIEGLLLNSRMANATFNDSNPLTQFLWRYPDTGEWDADRNTDEFSGRLAHYRGHGLDAVTVNLQGGGTVWILPATPVQGDAGRAGYLIQRRGTLGRAAWSRFTAMEQLAIWSGRLNGVERSSGPVDEDPKAN